MFTRRPTPRMTMPLRRIRRTQLSALAAVSGTLIAATPSPATRPATRPTAQAPTKPSAKRHKPTVEAEAFFATGPTPKFVIDVDPKQLKGLNDKPRVPVKAQI